MPAAIARSFSGAVQSAQAYPYNSASAFERILRPLTAPDPPVSSNSCAALYGRPMIAELADDMIA